MAKNGHFWPKIDPQHLKNPKVLSVASKYAQNASFSRVKQSLGVAAFGGKFFLKIPKLSIYIGGRARPTRGYPHVGVPTPTRNPQKVPLPTVGIAWYSGRNPTQEKISSGNFIIFFYGLSFNYFVPWDNYFCGLCIW